MKDGLTRSQAVRCFLLNLFLLPGAGSLKGGRRTAGVMQMLLLVIGTLMIIPLFLEAIGQFSKMYQGISQMADTGTGEVPQSWDNLKEKLEAVWGQYGVLALAGIGTMGAGWIWGFITGLSLINEAAQNEEQDVD
jgi:hypothetical protein